MNQTNRVECIIPQHVKPWKAGVNVENISLECSEDEDKDENGDLAEMKEPWKIEKQKASVSGFEKWISRGTWISLRKARCVECSVVGPV
jgi:hypothetical protein